MKHSSILLLASSALLSSCGLFGHYERDTENVQKYTDDLYRDPVASNATLEITDSASYGNTPWQEVYTEHQLQALIEKALAQNTNILQAENTIRLADIGLRLSKFTFLPSITLSPDGAISKVFDMGADNTKTYEVPVTASWQIDAFGTMRNAFKQSQINMHQAHIVQQLTQTKVINGMANYYYALQMLDAQKEITTSTLALWNKEIETMEAMKEYGYGVNSAAIASAKAQVLSIESSLITIDDKIREVENAVCALLHEGPHAIERAPFTAEGFPEEFSTGYPISLLANRPDVANAEAKLAYATYGVMGARGKLCPTLRITGTGSFTNSLGSMIVNPGKFIAAGVASMTQPIFQGGANIGNLKRSKIELENAQLDFEQTLLNAGQEVSNALSSYHSACESIAISEQQVAQLQKAYDDTEFLFHNGNTTTYLEILSSQMNLLNGQLGLINNRYSKVIAAISLYQALGGGRDVNQSLQFEK